MTYVITEACVDVKDRSCVRECPVDCIYEGERVMYIHPDECIDCGACEATCPVNAIVFDIDLEDDEKHLLERTTAFIAETGAGGGARSFGPLGRDHAAIALLPPQAAG